MLYPLMRAVQAVAQLVAPAGHADHRVTAKDLRHNGIRDIWTAIQVLPGFDFVSERLDEAIHVGLHPFMFPVEVISDEDPHGRQSPDRKTPNGAIELNTSPLMPHPNGQCQANATSFDAITSTSDGNQPTHRHEHTPYHRCTAC
jgi:hypothetical protein